MRSISIYSKYEKMSLGEFMLGYGISFNYLMTSLIFEVELKENRELRNLEERSHTKGGGKPSTFHLIYSLGHFLPLC